MVMSFEEFLMVSQFIENVEAKIGDNIEEKKRKKEEEEGVGRRPRRSGRSST